jgi:hypothetical protein
MERQSNQQSVTSESQVELFEDVIDDTNTLTDEELLAIHGGDSSGGAQCW